MESGGADSGAAYIFEKPVGGVWTDIDLSSATATATIQGANTADFFGNSVAISGDTAIVGAQ